MSNQQKGRRVMARKSIVQQAKEAWEAEQAMRKHLADERLSKEVAEAVEFFKAKFPGWPFSVEGPLFLLDGGVRLLPRKVYGGYAWYLAFECSDCGEWLHGRMEVYDLLSLGNAMDSDGPDYVASGSIHASRW